MSHMAVMGDRIRASGAIGEGSASVLIDSEPMRGYWWGLFAAEDPTCERCQYHGMIPRIAASVKWIHLSLECCREQSWRLEASPLEEARRYCL